MKRKARIRTILLIVAVALVVGLGGFSLFLYRELHTPATHTKANDYIEIPRRSTPEAIANKLLAEGVI